MREWEMIALMTKGERSKQGANCEVGNMMQA